VLTSFTVKNYRGFRDLTVGGLTRINIVAGENNTGKTSLLEAILLMLDPSHEVIRTICVDRGVGGILSHFADLVKWLFTGGVTSSPIEFHPTFDGPIYGGKPDARGVNGKTILRMVNPTTLMREEPNRYREVAFVTVRDWQHALVCDYSDDTSDFRTWYSVQSDTGVSSASPVPLKEHRFLASSGPPPHLNDDFSSLKIERKLSSILSTLRNAESRLIDLDLATLAGQPEIFADIGTESLVPLAFMGEGIRRLLAVVINIAKCPNGVILIDEIENGLHHSIHEKVWLAIGEAARVANCQVFATTHSYECIQAAQRAFADNGEEDLAFIRLERDGDAIRPIVVNERGLATAMEFDWEMR
jgi:AAA domain, putative AbiEii toxin, Type IV TA system/AAA ATPase domain